MREWAPGPELSARLHQKSGAARWRVSKERLAAAIRASVAHAFGGTPPAAAAVERYTDSLHIEDLALATACIDGDEGAWDFFVAEHRAVLYRAADALDPGGGARELADSLYADLYGLSEHEGERRSLLRYFHGRSKLTTWLRAVLSQRHVDRFRAGRRLDPLPDDTGERPLTAAPADGNPELARFQDVLSNACAAAIAALDPRDRLRLSCYYAEDMTLAAIGRMLKEHEATVSRHLARTRGVIRDAVNARLRADHGMDDAAIAECFRTVADDPGVLDLAQLVGVMPARKNPGVARSKS